MTITTGCVTGELEQLGVEFQWFGDPDVIPTGQDLIWDPWVGDGYTSEVNSDHTSTPILVTMAGAGQFALPLRELQTSVIGKLRVIKTRLLLKHRWRRRASEYARIITISEYARQELLAHLPLLPERVVPVHLGKDAPLLDLEDTATADGLGEPYFLHLSYFQPKKNIDRLLAAYLSIADAPGMPDLYLVSTEYPGTCDHPKVRLVPEDVTRAEIATYYRGAMAFVFPSLHETFAMPLTEAMLFGLPLITARTTVCPETAGDAALLVDPMSTESIAEAMRDVAGNAELRRELGERSKRRGEDFSWKRTAEAYLAIFEEVLSETR